jgi:predicted metal-dependent hydrolase
VTVRKSFVYGDARINYEIRFVATDRRKVAIHVHPDGFVQVDAPQHENVTAIHKAVWKRARWITRYVSETRRQRSLALPRNYRSGEALYYLGRSYQLKVKDQNGSGTSVKLLRGQIRVEEPSRHADAIRQHLSAWYRARAAAVFERRLTDIASRVTWLKEIPEWRLVRMRRQWGSCSPAGVILLNPHLVKAPSNCVEYVICHEICHLREHNHSPRYYRLLGQIMPGWELVKRKLDSMAELLLNE